MLLTVVPLLALLVQQPATPAPVKDSLTGATNVTRVDATLLCGGATQPTAYPELKKRGVVAVVNLRRDDEEGADIPASEAAAKEAGIKFIHIPVARTGPDTAAVDAFIAAVTDASNQPLYVHCASGNRVGAMWLVKRVLVDGWDVDRATAEATAIGLTSAELRQRALDYVASHKR